MIIDLLRFYGTNIKRVRLHVDSWASNSSVRSFGSPLHTTAELPFQPSRIKFYIYTCNGVPYPSTCCIRCSVMLGHAVHMSLLEIPRVNTRQLQIIVITAIFITIIVYRFSFRTNNVYFVFKYRVVCSSKPLKTGIQEFLPLNNNV